MAKISLRASGGLNKDIDPNNLPEGDYIAASNIVFDAGKTGGAGALRLMESFASTGITLSGSPRATFQNSDGIIYVLCNNTGGTATIYSITPSGSNFTSAAILTYTHFCTSVDMTPDLKVIGTILVWNYAEDGTILYFDLNRGVQSTAFTTLAPLKLQKETPNNVVTINKVISGTAVTLLESNDFQFAARYQYDTKEYSVLGNYSQMFKGEKGVSKYTITYDFDPKPTYAESIELYVRIGNDGTWRKADVQKISTYAGSIDWTGQVYESLDIVTTGKPFDAVPQNAKHIEIAKNRIFLANMQDDYSLDATNIALSVSQAGSNETALGAGTYKTYLASTTVDGSSSETAAINYQKPFANNSTYAVGYAYYDDALKTRGVEPSSVTEIKTGNFTYPIIPNIVIAPNGTYVKPAWVKYIQLAYSKNVSKSFIFEGFASNVFFELKKNIVDTVTKEAKEVLVAVQSVTKDDLPKINFLVVDLMGMTLAGQIYTLQEGDKISINVGTYSSRNILELRIKQQKGNLLYCEYNGGALTMPTIPVPSDLFFEIYTPKQPQEAESLLFYEYGNLIPIATGWNGNLTLKWDGSLMTDKLIGDMVLSKFEMPAYTAAPFLINYAKADETVNNQTTRVESTMSGTSLVKIGANPSEQYATQLNPSWTSIPTNDDGAEIIDASNAPTTSGGMFRVLGYYEAGKQSSGDGGSYIDVSVNLNVSANIYALTDPALAAGAVSGMVEVSVSPQVYRVAYDNTSNSYLAKPELYLTGFTLKKVLNYFNSGSGTTRTDVITGTKRYVAADFKDVNPGDKFYVQLDIKYKFTTKNDSGTQSNNTLTITGNGTPPLSFVMKLNRTSTTTTSSYNPKATVSTTKTKYIVRAISNALANQKWNTSAGKPSVLATNLTFARRSNVIRYSGNYVPGTNVNNVGSFFALDSAEVPVENGEITSLQRASRLQGNGAMLLALCLRESSYVFLGEQELTQGNNNSIRALTTNMIGTVRNMGNNLGLQNKLSVMNYKGAIWWWDEFNKKVVKYTDKGIEIPSDTFMRSHFLNKSGIARFSYDPFYNMAFIGFIGESTSMGYSDNLKRWIAEYSFVPTFAESYGDKMVLLNGGTIFKSLQSGYNTFFGGSNDGTISFVLNSRSTVFPTRLSVFHDMNVVDWTQSNYVKSNLLTIDITNENNQVSKLVEANFLMQDGRLYAHILRDKNTTGTIVERNLIEGNAIVGALNVFSLTLKDKTQNMRINALEVDVEASSGHS